MIELFKKLTSKKESDMALEERKLALEERKLALSHKILAQAQADEAAKSAKKEYKAPWLPTGVVPQGQTAPVAQDSCSSIYQYAAETDPNFYPSFMGYPALAMLSQSSDYRSVPETTATEMVRKWGAFKIDDPQSVNDETLTDEEAQANQDKEDEKKRVRQDKINSIEQEFERLKVRGLIQRAIEIDLTQGRAQIFIDLGDNQTELPFVESKVGVAKGSLKGLTVIEPMWSTPSMYNANDPLKSDFFVPERWYVMGKDVHADRLITLIMRPVPDMLKPAYNFGGISMLQLMQPYVQRYQRTADSISQLVHAFSLTILATDLSSILAGQNDPNILMRASLFNQYRDNTGIMLLDKESEEINQINTPITGLHELLTKSQEQMAAPSHLPLVKLLGVTPSGLNANSDGEIRVMYDYIMAQLETHIRPIIERISRLVQLSLFGDIDRTIKWKFEPLYQLDEKEEAETQEIKTRTVATAVDSGLVSQEEGRAALSQDDKSLFAGITVSDVPEQEGFDDDDPANYEDNDQA